MTESSERQDRPAIPAEIRRRVLVEAGHRCAIPQCRYIEIDIHHIIPWAICKSHEYDNLIALCPNCHSRADSGKIDRKSLRLYKFNLRFAHDKFTQLEMDLIFHLAHIPNGHGELFPKTNLIMLRRALEAGYIAAHDSPIRNIIAGYDAGPAVLILTEKGRKFLTEMGRDEF